MAKQQKQEDQTNQVITPAQSNGSETNEPEQPKEYSCFIVTPIGDNNSDIRYKTDGLIAEIIRPILMEFGFASDKVLVAHQMSNPGSINEQIIKQILDSTLVIVNLTGLNANVMYELAVRHAAAKPVISLCEREITPSLPFDINQERTIFYSDTFYGATLLKENLSSMVQEVMKTLGEDAKDNPIYRVVRDKLIKQEVKDKNPSEAPFVDLLIDIRNQIANLERNFAQQKTTFSNNRYSVSNRAAYDKSAQKNFDTNKFTERDSFKIHIQFANDEDLLYANDWLEKLEYIREIQFGKPFELIVYTFYTVKEIALVNTIYDDLKALIMSNTKAKKVSY